jgi:hypothetical protein
MPEIDHQNLRGVAEILIEAHYIEAKKSSHLEAIFYVERVTVPVRIN